MEFPSLAAPLPMRVPGVLEDPDPAVPVRERGRAVAVQPDLVAEDLVVHAARLEQHAPSDVARDHVALGERVAAHDRAGAAEEDAVAVPEPGREGRIRPDVTAR